MVDAQSFLANLERFSHRSENRQQYEVGNNANYEHGRGSEAQASYLVDGDGAHSHHFKHRSSDADLFADNDIPLDAFDKELLSEQLQERSQQTEQGLARISLRPKFSAHTYGHGQSRKAKDGLDNASSHNLSSSSSPTGMRSSPTVSVLQNRVPQMKRRDRSKMQSHSLMLPSLTAKQLDLEHAAPIVQGIQLVPATDLPDRFRSIFSYPIFNAVQSKCLPIAFRSEDNLVVSAPTGSGKTVVMELAICQLMAACKAGDFKVVYTAPTKSLCAERQRDWHAKFGVLDLQCAELTGDTEYNQLHTVQTANIIVTTPEKWDSVTRKWKDNARLMKMVKLFLIDEVHILKESRGATLEAVVSRMKSVRSKVRFIALSATIPNSEDIAAWLGKGSDEQHLSAHREVFGDEFRPARLQKIVQGFALNTNDYAFESQLNREIPGIIAKYSQRKPTMIFCFTRSSAISLSKMLSELWHGTKESNRLWQGPNSAIRVMDAELQRTSSAGVAFHHGGLDAADRRAVEHGFLGGNVKIICCTSTLAVGVNLPCYLVVIKGTVGWSDHGAQEYPDLEIMQMLGRAGRPQFESSACAVILTRDHKVRRYERMMAGEDLLESCLHLNLVDHLNAEIGLGTVYDLVSAKKWLAGTFLFVRLRRNPEYYQLNEDAPCSSEDELLEQLCEKEIKQLREIDLVSKQGRLESTKFGDAMARFYVRYETMKIIMALPPKAKTSEILSMLTQATEFRDLRLKSGEKSLYKEFNSNNAIKFPIKVDIALPAHKVSLLIQTELGACGYPASDGLKKHQSQYRIDKAMVFSHIHRLIRCVIDCQIQHEDSVSARHALELGRSLAARVWDNSPLQLKQIDNIGDVGVLKLASAGIKSIETLENSEARRIEMILNRNPPLGNRILACVAVFPNLRVSVKQMGKVRAPGHYVQIKFNAEIGFLNEPVPEVFNRKPIFVCFLAETSDGRVIDFRRFKAKKLLNGLEIFLVVKLTQPTASINCHVSCDDIAGTSKYAELKLDTFPSSCFPPTQLRQSDGGDSANTRAKARGSVNTAGKNLTDLECFGDFDLDDGDLLAMALHEEKTDAVEDLDELMADNNTHTKPKKRSVKRTASQMSTNEEQDEDSQVTIFREPQLLDNGRWTCQHDCAEKRKICKHKCCSEGVAKRRKAQRKKPEKRDDGLVVNNKNAGGTASKETKSPLEVAQKGFEEPKRKEKKNERKENRDLGTDYDDPKLSTRRATTQHDEDRDLTSEQRKRKRSFEQNPYGLVAGSRDDMWTTDVEQMRTSNTDDFFGDMDVLLGQGKRIDKSKNDEAIVVGDIPEPEAPSETPWEDTTTFADDDVETAGNAVSPGFDDSFWSTAHDEDEQFFDRLSLPEPSDAIPSDFFDSDIDLGGFEAPLSHVTLEEVKIRPRTVKTGKIDTGEKGIFITGVSSSPRKNMTAKGQISSQIDVGPAEIPERVTKVGREATESNIISPVKNQSPDVKTLEHDTPGALQKIENAQGSITTALVKEDPREETCEEREERLKEEEERKRWEGVDPEFYEMLKDCVEIV